MFSFGENIPTEAGDIVITPNLKYLKNYTNQKFQVSLRPIVAVAETYQKKVVAIPAMEFSNIINLSLNTAIKQKGIDILNELIFVYNQNYPIVQFQ